MALERSSSVAKKNDAEGRDPALDHERSGGEEMCASIERVFDGKEVPMWRQQLTLRAFVVSFVLGILFTFIVMKLNLTTGIIPSLNVSAGLLGFFFVKTWTKFLEKSGLLKQPFTRQENTVIQTCVVASSGIAFSGGFGSYLFGMSEIVAKQSSEAHDPQNIKNPTLAWMIGFLFVVSFLGLFSVVPLRKIMIIDFKLTYPSGTATAHLINSFHTPQGAKLAKKQVRALGKFFSFSFLWGFFQWFFTAGEDCGFVSFPTFGLKAYMNKFYFDFSATCRRGHDLSVYNQHITTSWSYTLMGYNVAAHTAKEGPLVLGRVSPKQSPRLARLQGLHSYSHDPRRRALQLPEGSWPHCLWSLQPTTRQACEPRSPHRVFLLRPRAIVRRPAQDPTLPQRPNPDMGRRRRLRRYRRSFRRHPPTHLRAPPLVLHCRHLHLRPCARLLQRVRVRPHRLVPRVHLRQTGHLCGGRVGRGSPRRGPGWPGRLWRHDEHRLHRLRSDAGLQDGLHDAGVAAVHVREPDHRDGDGVRDLAMRLLALLQGVCRLRGAGVAVLGAVRAGVPEHGHPRGGGVLVAAGPLLDAVLRVLRGGGGDKRAEGRGRAEVGPLHSSADGDGDPVLHRGVFCNRHVRGELDTVCVGEGEQGGGGGVRAGGGIGVDMRGRDMDTAELGTCTSGGEAAHVHEVPGAPMREWMGS